MFLKERCSITSQRFVLLKFCFSEKKKLLNLDTFNKNLHFFFGHSASIILYQTETKQKSFNWGKSNLEKLLRPNIDILEPKNKKGFQQTTRTKKKGLLLPFLVLEARSIWIAQRISKKVTLTSMFLNPFFFVSKLCFLPWYKIINAQERFQKKTKVLIIRRCWQLWLQKPLQLYKKAFLTFWACSKQIQWTM